MIEERQPVVRAVSALDVTVIVPVYNPGSYLQEQLEALDSQVFDGSWELILVDNGSTDGSWSLIESWAADRSSITALDGSQVRGAGYARNVGAAAASGALLLYTDADDVVAQGWLAAMHRASAHGDLLSGVDVASPTDWAQDATSQIAEAPAQRSSFLAFARGGNFGITAAALSAVGGWDETWIRGQDVELSWRAQTAGMRMVRVPDAKVLYRRPNTLRGRMAQQYEFGRRAPDLLRALSSHGAPKPSLYRASVQLLKTLLRVPYLLLPSRSQDWLVNLAGVSGRWIGTVRSRPDIARLTSRHDP